MKNKMFLLCISLMLLVGLTGCGNSDDGISGKINTSNVSISINSIDSSQSSTKLNSLDEICNYLDDKGYIDISTKNIMTASIIGAVKGYSFTGCEIYEYESTCPETMDIYGLEVPFTARNGKYGLYISGRYPGDKMAFKNEFLSLTIE